MSPIRCIAALCAAACLSPAYGQTPPPAGQSLQRDGSHDFDFLIGNWKAHVRRLPDRLVGSHSWVEYDGISNHHKILDSNSNFEQFEVKSTDGKQHLKAQTLRLYNPETHEWSIYLVDADKRYAGPAPGGRRV